MLQTLGDLDINHLARLVSFHARYDCLDYGSHHVAALRDRRTPDHPGNPGAVCGLVPLLVLVPSQSPKRTLTTAMMELAEPRR